MTIGHVRIFKGLKPINPFDTMPMKTMKGRGGSPKQKATKKMKPMKGRGGSPKQKAMKALSAMKVKGTKEAVAEVRAHVAQADEEARDRVKQRKFEQMKHELPKHVLDLYENAGKSEVGLRAKQTQIINTIFKKDENGKLRLHLDAPLFKEHLEKYTKKFGRDENTGIPRSLMAEKFRDGELGLQRAIAKGEIEEFDEDGVQFCAYRRITVGKEEGTSVMLKLKQASPIFSNVYLGIDFALSQYLF